MPNPAPKRSFESVRRPDLVDEVIQQLRSRLASGDFEVGETIPSESALVAELGVGRTTLREAVRVLEHDGILEVRQGSGTFVRALSGTDSFGTRLRQARVTEVLDVRRALELEIVRMAAVNRTQASLRTMRKTLAAMKGSLGVDAEMAFLEADMSMYRTLAASTKNSVLVEVHAHFAQALHTALTQIIRIPEVRSSCLDTHERLVAAIADRDADLAESLVRGHLDHVTSLVAELMGNARLTGLASAS